MNPNTEHKIATTIGIVLTLILIGWVSYVVWKVESDGQRPGTSLDPTDPLSIQAAGIRAAVSM
jgi:hypothetical protein